MGNSKVIFGNETLIDLTGDTVTPDTLLAGTTAHNRSGNQIVGTATVPDTLDDLTDVSITSAADGDLLQYNGTSGEWENSSAVPNAIDVLEDVGAINKFNNTATSQTINGVTWTVNSDGTVTADSAGQPATANSFFDISVNGKIATGAYRLTACPAGGSDNTYGASVHYTTGAPWWSGNDTGDGAVLDVKALDYIRLYVSAGVTVSNVLFKPMISDARLNLSYADYQPYAETNPVLTQKVSALEETGSVNLAKNTLTSRTVNGITAVVNSNGSVTVSTEPGGATAATNFPIFDVNQDELNKYGSHHYYLSGCPAGGGANKYRLYLHPGQTGGSWNTAVYDDGNGTEFDYDGNSLVYCAIRILAGTVITTPITFKPQIALAPGISFQPYAMTNRELSTIEDITSEFSYASGIIARTDWTRIIRCGKLISVQMRFTTPSTVTDGIAVMSVPEKYTPKIAKQNNNAMVCGGLMSTTSWNGAILGVLAWYNNNFILMSTGWQTSKECVIQFNYLID